MAYSNYDGFAPIYDQHWSSFVSAMLPALDDLALDGCPPPASILDLCCGTGQLSALLHARGYDVTGIDGSRDMLRFARQNAPGCRFIAEDVRTFSLPPEYDIALSTFDSLNHIMTLDELNQVFSRTQAALKPGGTFVFDLNTRAGFEQRGDGTFGRAEDDHAFIGQFSFDAATNRSQLDLVLYYWTENATWERTDLTLVQTCYTTGEIDGALAQAGFINTAYHDAHDLNLGKTPGARLLFVAHKAA
ncbi:MAG: class I SAM-dependent methyltransferase [Anaerolineae bacterium]|nr:class I SAM-dependent methyltransferase [Anaerolineae bacterium]